MNVTRIIGLILIVAGIAALGTGGFSFTKETHQLKLGPVDTPMTRDHKKTRLFATAVDAARGIVAALDAGAAEAYVPAFWAAIMPIVKATPVPAADTTPPSAHTAAS